MSDTIDLTEQLEGIRARFSDYRHATREAAKLWGCVDCNDSGVFAASEQVAIELTGQPQWRAAVHLGRSPCGWWNVATDYSYPHGGRYAPLSVWSRTAYTHREGAFAAGVRELRRDFEGIRNSKSHPDTFPALASRMIEQLAQAETSARQLVLL